MIYEISSLYYRKRIFMNLRICSTLFVLLFLFFVGCQKKTDISEQTLVEKNGMKNIPPEGFFVENERVPGVVYENSGVGERVIRLKNTSDPNSSPDPDNGDEPIILGQQLNNPYSVANMQQAVNVLYGGNYPISASHFLCAV